MREDSRSTQVPFGTPRKQTAAFMTWKDQPAPKNGFDYFHLSYEFVWTGKE
jgi:hypothetical protein